MDIATFRTNRPEFRDVPPDAIADALAIAGRRISATVWGTQYDDGVSLLAAHYLTTTPFGGGTRLVPDPTKTSTYLLAFEDLQSEVCAGRFLVAGGFW